MNILWIDKTWQKSWAEATKDDWTLKMLLIALHTRVLTTYFQQNTIQSIAFVFMNIDKTWQKSWAEATEDDWVLKMLLIALHTQVLTTYFQPPWLQM